MLQIADLEVSSVFLFKEQTYFGRCVVAYKDHDVELVQIDDDRLLPFMHDVQKVANAIQKAFNPAKINFGFYSDKLKHLHVHIVPKYVDGPDYGGVFAMNPQTNYLSDEQYSDMISKIKAGLLR
jgi:diadenosine tetraphosphate (Ap4A) HIT family hydrolase